eukprot:TRINITY_DN4484_c0_g1_i1.p1 TRINITY_DN4484_c0_g1~~TRINITY_DN4484_c0_g1_i1.p1  ORF type:complete len:260 (-),score=82.74 TRINITY_DN4484_c0_g1_i1:120-809(-)
MMPAEQQGGGGCGGESNKRVVSFDGPQPPVSTPTSGGAGGSDVDVESGPPSSASSGGSASPFAGSGTGDVVHKISPSDVQHVQALIERCLQNYANEPEIIESLYLNHSIEPGFTSLVLTKLQDQNPYFFKAYQMRLTIKEQIQNCNQLMTQQVQVLQNPGSVCYSVTSPPVRLPLTPTHLGTPSPLSSPFGLLRDPLFGGNTRLGYSGLSTPSGVQGDIDFSQYFFPST